jgi:hypothetical protein
MTRPLQGFSDNTQNQPFLADTRPDLLLPAPRGRFDDRELAMGVQVEMEHTRNPKVAELIAKHHLSEDPRYYTKLRSVHLDAAYQTYYDGSSRLMGAQLGDARSDIVSALAVFMGKSKAEAWMRSLESVIKTKAQQGAEAAIPKIRAEVESSARKIVTPMIVTAGAIGAVGVLLGGFALYKSRKR